MTVLASVACRAWVDGNGNRVGGCGAGWWAHDLGVDAHTLLGPSPTIAACPRCGGPLIVTGTLAVVDLGLPPEGGVAA